jgi:regulator of RNase E activity RraA
MATPAISLEKPARDSLEAVIARLAALPVACISDAMDQLGLPTALIDAGISRRTGKRLAGRARTIDRAPRPSNATQAEVAPDLAWAPQTLWDEASPGDVAVMAIRGDTSVAVLGDNMSTRALMRGVAGAVIDGAMRDIDAISEMGLTVYARASSPRSAAGRLVTFALNKPIICGGVYVRPGDVVIGDADGVIVIPAEKASEVAERSELLESKEQQSKEYIEAGNSLVEAVKKFKVK